MISSLLGDQSAKHAGSFSRLQDATCLPITIRGQLNHWLLCSIPVSTSPTWWETPRWGGRGPSETPALCNAGPWHRLDTWPPAHPAAQCHCHPGEAEDPKKKAMKHQLPKYFFWNKIQCHGTTAMLSPRHPPPCRCAPWTRPGWAASEWPRRCPERSAPARCCGWARLADPRSARTNRRGRQRWRGPCRTQDECFHRLKHA